MGLAGLMTYGLFFHESLVKTSQGRISETRSDRLARSVSEILGAAVGGGYLGIGESGADLSREG
jgi:hypothetical protein